MLFGLSKDGHAPKSFSLTDSRGVPRRSVFFTSVFLFAAIPLLFAGDGVVAAFTFVSSMCATMILFTWGSIVVSYIVYPQPLPGAARQHPKLQDADRLASPRGSCLRSSCSSRDAAVRR